MVHFGSQFATGGMWIGGRTVDAPNYKLHSPVQPLRCSSGQCTKGEREIQAFTFYHEDRC